MPSKLARWVFLVALTALLFGCKDRCKDTTKCTKDGKCTSRGEVCIATSDDDCRASAICTEQGRCRAFGSCVAASDEDCRASSVCKSGGRCFARNNLCCTEHGPCEEPKPNRDRPDNKEGCPCGCDHSEKMASELLGGSPIAAATGIAKSLAAIAEREDAGYITLAMVEHRIRLLSVAEHFALDIPPRPFAPDPTGDVAPTLRENARLRAAADLVVHGEHSEIVLGREKLLHAAFRVHLRLENSSDQSVTLSRPTLTGNRAFDVARWYVLGTEGEPWNGRLGPHTKLSVFLIGGMSSEVRPGDDIQATLIIDGMQLPLATHARQKWYGLDAHASCPGPRRLAH